MNVATRITLSVFALVAGTLAAIAGSPKPGLADDEISAVDLAEWLRDRRAGLAIVDARAIDAIERDRVPGSRSLAGIDVDTLAQTVVVYGDDTIEPSELGALRRHSGGRILRLHGGMRAWNDDVLFPVVRSDASTRQQHRFEARAQLSRYFGGTPRRLEPGSSSGRTRSRRGC